MRDDHHADLDDHDDHDAAGHHYGDHDPRGVHHRPGRTVVDVRDHSAGRTCRPGHHAGHRTEHDRTQRRTRSAHV